MRCHNRLKQPKRSIQENESEPHHTHELEVICIDPQYDTKAPQEQGALLKEIKHREVKANNISHTLTTAMVICMILSVTFAQTESSRGACNKNETEERNITDYILKELSVLERSSGDNGYYHPIGVAPSIAEHYMLEAKSRKIKTGHYLPENTGWKCHKTFLTQICQNRQHKTRTCITYNGTLVRADGKRSDKNTLWWKQNYKFTGKSFQTKFFGCRT